MILGGRSASTCSLVRRRMKGITERCRPSSASRPVWAALLPLLPAPLRASCTSCVDACRKTRACTKCMHVENNQLAVAHLQGLAVRGIEMAFRPQKPRHEKVKQAPELQNVVLQGGATQEQPVPC